MPYSILIINPNTSTHMTDALKPIVQNLRYDDIKFDYFTAPEFTDTPVTGPDGDDIEGVPSIDNGEESALSAVYCLPSLRPLVHKYDAFLVACYSAHPLVGLLKQAIAEDSFGEKPGDGASSTGSEDRGRAGRKQYVTGIFEASVSTALALVSGYNITSGFEKLTPKETFGIISTGKVWEEELGNAVKNTLAGNGGQQSSRFGGVETTGLTAVELHSTPAEEVHRRVTEATERLVRKSQVGAICLGCAGMAGMEESVREGCVKVLGPVKGSRVRIVDGVVAGVGILVNACKAGF